MTDTELAARLLCKLRGWHEQDMQTFWVTESMKEACDECGARIAEHYPAEWIPYAAIKAAGVARWPA